MKYFQVFHLFLAILFILHSEIIRAEESFIPLQNNRLESIDLEYNGQILIPELVDLPLDLSKLNPRENTFWNGANSSKIKTLNSVSFSENETVYFEGGIGSASGLYRFNVRKKDEGQFFTIHLSKSLHTLLMRKYLLRKLGYYVTDIKHIKKVKVIFPTKLDKELFIKREVPTGTFAATARWIVEEGEKELVLQDVAVSSPNELDYYDASLGVVRDAANYRSVKSLIIPYTILDLEESVNKFDWIVGRMDNEQIILPHFINYEFNTTLNDARWIFRRIGQLSEQDWKDVVEFASFPKEVEKIVLQKIISRRNSLTKLLSMENEIAEYSFEASPSIKPRLVKGKVEGDEWDGYASRFAHGDDENSPFKEIRFFAYSKLRSELINNLLAEANKYLEVYDLSEPRMEYFQEQFKKGLKHFVETGELLPIKVGTWWSPVVDGRIIVSRDIVIGNYLGTDNVVQMADNLGYAINLGAHLGIEGLGYDLSAFFRTTANYVRTFTHLKPVKSLKLSWKEPLNKMLVNLVKSSISDKFDAITNVGAMSFDEYLSEEDRKKVEEQKAKTVETIMSELEKTLGVGESLIITGRLVPSSMLKANFNNGIYTAGTSFGTDYLRVNRVQFFRKNKNLIQIYKDIGRGWEFNFSYNLTNKIPILKVKMNKGNGAYGLNVYNVQINSDLKSNPNFYQYASGIHQVIDQNSFEELDKIAPPLQLDASYSDFSFGGNLLFFTGKKLNTDLVARIKTPQGLYGDYLVMSKESLSGFNYEAFVSEIANYYIGQNTDKFLFGVDKDKNPGETIFGHSSKKQLHFESEFDSEKVTKPYLGLTLVQQGWAKNKKQIQKYMQEINAKYMSRIFDPNSANDIPKLRLYNFTVDLSLYEDGVERLNLLRPESFNQVEQKYKAQRMSLKICDEDSTWVRTVHCGDLHTLKYWSKKCKNETDAREHAKCLMSFLDVMHEQLEFEDFKSILGESNFFLSGTIDGFRSKSEVMADTIHGNSVGVIKSENYRGPFNAVKQILGLQSGEAHGQWLRESL